VKRTLILVAAVLVLLAALGGAGCRRVKLSDGPNGGGEAQPKTVALGAATSLDTKIKLGVGTFTLAAADSTPTLALDARFTYPAADWKPIVDYSVEGTLGVLSVIQPEGSVPLLGANPSASWDVKLAAGVPTRLSIDTGVGESDIFLRGIDVSTLAFVSGVGQSKIDLSGPRPHDLTGTIDSGVGEVDITVPRSVGVRLTGGADGVGQTTAPGFTKDGDSLVNAAWSQPGPKIDLALTRGVGEIKVISAE
jgi:hypothetical protein